MNELCGYFVRHYIIMRSTNEQRDNQLDRQTNRWIDEWTGWMDILLDINYIMSLTDEQRDRY